LTEKSEKYKIKTIAIAFTASFAEPTRSLKKLKPEINQARFRLT
jgi:hypothetical protein